MILVVQVSSWEFSNLRIIVEDIRSSMEWHGFFIMISWEVCVFGKSHYWWNWTAAISDGVAFCKMQGAEIGRVPIRGGSPDVLPPSI